MGLTPFFLAGPLVAVVGIVAVFFVMRRRAVDKKSMYSARRSQIERKVRAARQRTLAPTGRHAKEGTATQAPAMEFGMEAKPAAPTATWGPPAGAPAQETWASPPAAAAPADTWATPAAAPAPVQQPWDVGPAAPASPKYAPSPGPAYTPPPPEPAYAPPSADNWVPSAPSAAPKTIPPPMEPAAASAGGAGAAWEVVGQAAPAA